MNNCGNPDFHIEHVYRDEHNKNQLCWGTLIEPVAPKPVDPMHDLVNEYLRVIMTELRDIRRALERLAQQ